MPPFRYILALTVSLTACNHGAVPSTNPEDNASGTETTNHLLSVDEFERSIEAKDGILLDVRTPEEVAEGHLALARNIDFKSDSFEAQVSELDRTQPVYVYCRSGRRSAAAVDKMKQLGFEDVYDLDGGIVAWQAAEKPVETP